jgi:pimeloyl-ACP methyl ester carboxylesterase
MDPIRRPIHPRIQRRRDLAASLAIPAGLEGTFRKFARPGRIAAVILSVGVVIAAVAALVRVYPELPPLAGSFLVGTTKWDEGLRSASGSAPDAGSCSVTVQLWYPAKPETGVGPAPYDWGNEGFLSVRRWVKTGAKLDAAVAAAPARFPILLYFPAWDGGPVPYAAMARDLAGRGFIIAVVGYDAPDCARPDGAVTSPRAGEMDFSSAAAFARTVEIADTKIVRVAASAAKVLDALESLDRDDPRGRFTGRLDLSRTAAIGHSLGGAIALQVAWLDPRIKAAIDLDGWVFNTAHGGWPQRPVLVVMSDDGATFVPDLDSADPDRRYRSVLDLEDSQRISAGFAKFGGVEATIGNSRHEDFSDSPYISRRAAFWGRRPDGHAIRAAGDCVVTFLESVFRGDASPSCKTSTSNVQVVVAPPFLRRVGEPP